MTDADAHPWIRSHACRGIASIATAKILQQRGRADQQSRMLLTTDRLITALVAIVLWEALQAIARRTHKGE